jgi:hypothetical protein
VTFSDVGSTWTEKAQPIEKRHFPARRHGGESMRTIERGAKRMAFISKPEARGDGVKPSRHSRQPAFHH